MAAGAASSIISGASSAAAGGLFGSLGLIGLNKRNKRLIQQQEESQMRLNEQNAQLNYDYGELSADAAHERSLGLLAAQTEANSYESQVADLNKAGLNVGLLYGGAGGGGGASAGGGAQGQGAGNQKGQAPNYLEIEAIKNERRSVNAQLAQVAAETSKAHAERKQIEAETENIKDQTETSRELTGVQKELIKQQAIEKAIDNVRKDWENSGGRDQYGEFKDLSYESLGHIIRINKGSVFDEKGAAELAETISRKENNKALSELNTAKKTGYWTELMNAVSIADSEKMKAEAIKLAAEFQTGEFTNWKTWINEAKDAFRLFIELAKAAGGN